MSLKPQCPEGYLLNKDNCRCRKKKKCPKGTRKNKETGECESKNMQKTKKTKKTEIITKTPASNLFSDDTIKISKKTLKKTTKKKTPSNSFKKLTRKLTMPSVSKPKLTTIIEEPSQTKTPSKIKVSKTPSKIKITKSKISETKSKSVARTGKRCPKGYKYNPLTRECDSKEKTEKLLSTIFSVPEEENTKSKTRKSKVTTRKSKTVTNTRKKLTKTRKNKTIAVTKQPTKVSKTRLTKLSKTLKKEYSPTINKEIMSLISQTPHKDLFVSINCNLYQITIVTPSGEELCYDWNSKEAQKYMLDNLRSNKKIVPGHIIGPAQTENNCWVNTFFAIFFLSDKGRKFLRFFRESMITGKIKTTTKTKKFNKKVHKAFWVLNRFITASLLGTQDIGGYASLIDTNDVVQNLYEVLPKKFKYKKSKEAGNPISLYISILLYIENFGHGPATPFPLYTHFINHDIEEFNALPDTIKTMETIPHMIIVEITDARNDGPKPKDFKKEPIITSGKYKYQLDAVAIRDVDKNHVSALITLNGADYKLDGEDFSPVRKFKWKNLINKNKSFKITKTIGEKYNFTKSYQALVYYRIK